MSINHIIDNNESQQLKIDIECRSLTTRDALNVICLNDDEVNMKMPNKGTNGDVLNSDGAGGVYWGAPTGSSGVAYQGINPVPVGTHYKISNTTGSEVVDSKLIETTTELSLTSLNITSAGQYNSTIINNGNIQATGTSDLDLYPSTGNTIRLHGETSAEDHKIINCLNPTNPQDVATKDYVDNNAGGISYTGGQPTILGEMLKFSSTDGSSVDKSVMVETATNFNLGSLAIVNVGDVDGVDLSAFKTDYDSKVNQNVKTTANVTFASVTTPIITNFGQNLYVNNLVFKPTNIYGGETIGGDLNLYSNDTATQGTIRLHSETSAEDNKIINCAEPTISTDVATKNYVDSQISTIPQQTYDLIVPLTTETGSVNSSGVKYTLYAPRGFNISLIKATLNESQDSGSLIQCQVISNGFNVLSAPLQFNNGSVLSSSPILAVSSISTNDKLQFSILTYGDGTAQGLKISIVGFIP